MIRLIPIFPPRLADDFVRIPLLEPNLLPCGASIEEHASPASERPP